jgi:hypothetical protein
MQNATTFSHWVHAKAALALALLALAALAGCGSYKDPGPDIKRTPPAFTYSFGGLSDMAEANRMARRHCSRYGGVPRTQSVATNRDGTRAIVFECVAAGASRAGV